MGMSQTDADEEEDDGRRGHRPADGRALDAAHSKRLLSAELSQVVDHDRDDGQQQHDGDGRAKAEVAVGEVLAVELVAITLGAELAAGHDDDDVEDLQGEDDDRRDDRDDGAPDLRDDDVEEDLALGGAVDAAASSSSAGMPLIAAEKRTMAKPACSQIMMTIRKRLFHGWMSDSPGLGLATERHDDRVEQADLRLVGVPHLVHEVPDDARADERDGHGHEDHRLASPSRSGCGRPGRR